MEYEIGDIVLGKVTGITKFGAFVTIAPGKSGLVHISEISSAYVSDVNEFLSEGQEVKVKIIGFDKSGRLNLSIKAALDVPEAETRIVEQTAAISAASAAPTFEDKLKRFMQDSNKKISGLKKNADKKNHRRRGR